MQELTKIANYKLIYFPNLTTAFCKPEAIEVEEMTYEYDNFINDQRIHIGEGSYQQKNELWIELFNKVARFLKVSSGTYNLTRNF